VSRVLVTGAGGFIGRHTLAPLLAAGCEVHAVSSRSLSAAANVEVHRDCAPLSGVGNAEVRPHRASLCGVPDTEVRRHRADLLAPGVAAELIEEVRPSHLLHFAWCTEPGVYWTTLENIAWVQASLSLLRAFGEAGGRRAVLAGTCAEYAWAPSTHCVEEGVRATPLLPATLYGAAKHGLHVVAEGWARQCGVSLAWGRIFFLYGPHEHPNRLVSGVARALLRGEQAPCSHGRQVRDFLSSPEVGSAFAALLRSEVTGAVNVASGEPVSLAEVVETLARIVGRSDLLCLGTLPANPAEPQRLTADVRRLREEVGWSPTVGLHAGIERTVEWWREELSGDAGGPQRGPCGGHPRAPA